MANDLRVALVAYRTAQRRMLERWADGDEAVRRELWQDLHACEELANAVLEGETLYQCPRCNSGPRPREEWSTRYGIMTCGICLPHGYVIMPEVVA